MPVKLKFRISSLIIAVLTLFLSNYLFSQTAVPDPGPVFQDNNIPRIDIYMEVDSLVALLTPDEEDNVHHFPALFIFDDGTDRDTVENAGFRLRGNTSLDAAKKSFKVSFNTFQSGRKFKGLEKLNLNGNHNDPTICRPKLCWDFLGTLGLPGSRSNHIDLYINDVYFGIYANVEHIDEEFAGLRFGNNNGNLYKCTWPADLAYLGDNPDFYKLESFGNRVYELKTNTEEDDYSDLAEFIDVLNNTNPDDFPCALDRVFNVDAYLKYLAFDMLTGNWDGPVFNKNNFYLYQNTATGKFEYLPYDLDNTFGIAWLEGNWPERAIYNWANQDEPRPIYTKIMAVDDFRNRFSYYMNQMLGNQYNEANLFPYLDQLEALITPSAEADTFRPLDYGYSMDDLMNGFENGLSEYWFLPNGLKDFITLRHDAALAQLQLQDISPVVNLVAGLNLPSSQSVLIQGNIEDDGQITEALICYQLDNATEVCQLLFDDGLHLDELFGDGIYGSTISTGLATGVLSYYLVAADNTGNTTRSPLCEDQYYELLLGNVGTGLVVNEIMASNDATVSDEFGEYDDWIELFNGSDQAISLAGKFLSDDQAEPNKWALPDVTLEPGFYYLVWADNDPEQGDNHATFKLSAAGEFAGIFGPQAEGHPLIDGVDFALLGADEAFGRLPNGTGSFQLLSPTPGYSNQPLAVDYLKSEDIPFDCSPNPWKEDLQISAGDETLGNFQVILSDFSGQILNEKACFGKSDFIWSDLEFTPGIYFILLKKDNRILGSRKIIHIDAD